MKNYGEHWLVNHLGCGFTNISHKIQRLRHSWQTFVHKNDVTTNKPPGIDKT